MKSCRCRRAFAFTLLEVVVGLTLMASVLVASLLAFSAHQKQRRHAEAKLAAVAYADDLLADLTSLREGVPVAGRGVVPGRPNWIWTTNLITTAAAAQVPIKVIRLEIIELTAQGRARQLTSVDVVEAIEP